MKQILLPVLLLTVWISAAAQVGDKTEVVFWHAMGGPLGDALNELVQDFNRGQDSIYVKAINMGNYGALSTKLFASLQTDRHPDVAQAFESWTANFASAGRLVPLDRYIDEALWEELKRDVYPVFLASNTIRDTLWSFPFNKSVRVLYYNKDMFFRSGIEPYDRPPKTWDDFRRYCKVLTEYPQNGGDTPEVYGTTLAVSAWQFENLLLQAGGHILAPGGTTPRFHEEPGVQALSFLDSLLNVDKTALYSTGYEGQRYFQAEQVAMVEGSSVSMAYMELTGIDFNLGIGPIPIRDSLKTNIVSGTNVVIFKSGRDRVERAAWEFVRWFTDTEQTARWSERTYYMPVRRSAILEPGLKRRMESNPAIKEVYEQLEYATFEPTIDEWYRVRKYLEEQVIERVLRREETPREALDKAARELVNLLEGSPRKEGEKRASNPWHVTVLVLLAFFVIAAIVLLIVKGIKRIA